MSSSRLLIRSAGDVTLVEFVERHIRDELQLHEIGERLYGLVDTEGRKQLLLDFANVHSLSSASLSILIILKKKIDKADGRIVICGLRDELREVFRISKLERNFEFYDNRDEGLASFGTATA